MTPRKILQRGREAWKVTLWENGRQVRNIVRPTKQAAQQAATDWLSERQQFGAEGAPDMGERMLVARYRGQLTLREMDEALAHAVSAKLAGNRALAEAAAAYQKEHEQEWSERHKYNRKYRLKLLCAAFPARQLNSLTGPELFQHLRSLGASAKNQRQCLHAFFGWCQAMGWLAADPLAKVQKPGAVASPEEKVVFSPEHLRLLLERASPKLQTLLVLGGLCGLRYAEVLRAERAHLDLEQGLLYVPKMKTQKRGMRERWVQLPANALSWLKSLPLPEEGQLLGMNDRYARLCRERLMGGLALGWPDNVLRRSFGSHHLAAFEDSAKTAALMGHTDASTTYAKYYRAVPKAVGEAWFAILPPKRKKLPVPKGQARR